ncbi:MAG: rhomboid family intramembrane serine protease [Halorhabdus sp.]
MTTCDVCGKQTNMPYHCDHCGGTFCAEHRLPENHDCPGLDDWNDPGGVFDSGFDDSVSTAGGTGSSPDGVLDRLGIDTGPGGVLGYFRGNMTYVFLILMAVTFFAQELFKALFVEFTVGPQGGIYATTPDMWELYRSIFILQAEHPEYVWTWFTSIFAHGGISHIVFNGIVIFFFGRLVEDYIGSRDFTLLFLGSGVLAGLGQIAIMLVQATPGGVLGASGAALAIMGVLTILNPGLRVYLYFIIPLPIWVLTIGMVAINVLGMFGTGGGGVANAAHLVGLAIGLAYGQHVRNQIRVPNQLQLGGGGRGPGGPGGPGRGRGPF